jgi:type II secretory pathway pseudopilin PulG
MGKGKKSSKKAEHSNSSKKKVGSSKSKDNISSFDEIKDESKKVNESNYNFTITVYKLNNGQYSLYNNSTSNLISNNINNFQNYLNQNEIPKDYSNNKSEIKDFNVQIPIPKINVTKDNHPVNYSLNFKNKNFESKLRAKTEKNYRNSKNMKNLGKEGKDAISYKIYCDIEAGPSILPKRKYCDFTGLTSNYNELHTGIRYYNSQIYKMSQNIPQPIKDQYLNIRKALIRLK